MRDGGITRHVSEIGSACDASGCTETSKSSSSELCVRGNQLRGQENGKRRIGWWLRGAASARRKRAVVRQRPARGPQQNEP